MSQLCVINGDGIGHEVIPVAVEVLHRVIPDLDVKHAEAGWECFQQQGASVPEKTLRLIQECGAGLFGAVSSPSKKVDGYHSAILTIRQSLKLYANLRPVSSLPNFSTREDVDLVVVRENSEGLYCGRERSDGETAIAERVITKTASERIARKACEIARRLQRETLTIVHKANVLPLSDGLFRDTVRNVVAEHNSLGSNLEVNELLVDVAALKLLAEPDRIDMIVTSNLFGDILSDAASHWAGGLGMAPSLNWGDSIGVAEPVHGSAPDIAGQGIANPIAAILSAELLVRHVWLRPDSADQILSAVNKTCRNWNRFVDGPPRTETIKKTVLGYLD